MRLVKSTSCLEVLHGAVDNWLISELILIHIRVHPGGAV